MALAWRAGPLCGAVEKADQCGVPGTHSAQPPPISIGPARLRGTSRPQRSALCTRATRRRCSGSRGRAGRMSRRGNAGQPGNKFTPHLVLIHIAKDSTASPKAPSSASRQATAQATCDRAPRRGRAILVRRKQWPVPLERIALARRRRRHPAPGWEWRPGPDVRPRPLAQTAGHDHWPRCPAATIGRNGPAPTIGPDGWPRPLAKTSGLDQRHALAGRAAG
jgi:hypothetical protein